MLLFHEEKILGAGVRLTSHSILEISNPSRIHSHSRKEAAKDQANEHRSLSPFVLRVHLFETTVVTGGCDEGAVEAAIAGIDFIGSIRV